MPSEIKAPLKNTEDEQKQTDEWFAERLDELKKMSTITETRLNDAKRLGTPTASATFVTAHLCLLYRHMIEVYGLLKEIVTKIDEYETEFQQRKPTWDYMQKAMEHTQELLQDGK